MSGFKYFVIAATIVCFIAPAFAKKKESKCPDGLKKIVAVGQVDAGSFSFEEGDPTSLGKLLQNQLRKEIEAKGCYVTVLHEPVPEKEAPPTEAPEATPPPAIVPPSNASGKMTAQQAAQLMQQSQQMVAQMMQMTAKAMGGAAPGQKFSPAAAQLLVRAKVATGRGNVDTGGAASVAGMFLEGANLANFSSETFKVAVDCIELDPQFGTIIDQETIKTSSTNLNRVAGIDSYYYADSGDQQKAYDKLFKKGIKKCANHIDDQLKKKEWEGQIFKIEGNRVFINAGALANVQPGMQFRLLQKEAVRGGGTQFGTEEKWAGVVQIEETNDQYSIGKLTVGGPAQVGQGVKIVR